MSKITSHAMTRRQAQSLHILILWFALALFTAAGAASEPGAAPRSDENWLAGFHPVGIDSKIYASVVYEGDLVVAGPITEIEGEEFQRIARYDGSQWHSLDPTFTGTPMCLTVWDGKLVVGGYISAGFNGVAAWDGQSWSPVGNGPGDPVFALTVFQGELIADNKRWTGTAWETLAGGEPNDEVRSLAVYEDQLYIGGDFTEIGGLTVNGIAVWDGESFSALNGGAQGDAWGICVFDMLVHEGRLVAGGRFHHMGGMEADGAAAWDGQNWSAFGDYNLIGYYDDVNYYWVDPEVRALGVYAGKLFIGGFFKFVASGMDDLYGIACWDGVEWSGTNGDLGFVHSHARFETFEVFDDRLIAGGSMDSCGDVFSPSILAWDGQDWSGFGGNGLNEYGSLYALGKFEGDVIAGGEFRGIGQLATRNVARWDGEAWHPLADGLNDEVRAFIYYDGDLVIGGSFSSSNENPQALRCVVRWDGANWSPLGWGISGALGSEEWSRPSVDALAIYDGELIAAGAFYWTNGEYAYRLARWDGIQWQEFEGGIQHGDSSPDYFVTSLALYGGDLIVAGRFTDAGGTPVANIARWDGAQWQGLDGGLDGQVQELLVYNGDLIAGGLFQAAGGVAAPSIARWDGMRWQAMAESFDGSVSSLGRYGNRLAVGGYFDKIDGVPHGGIAFWGGAEWSSLGTGTDGSVYTLYSISENLYVGGLFELAGDELSQGFGIYREDLTGLPQFPSLAAKGVLTEAYPNPFNPSTVLSFTLFERARLRLSIHDARGRLVRQLLAGTTAAGEHEAVWNGRDIDGRPVASGVYFCHLDLDGELLARKLTLLK